MDWLLVVRLTWPLGGACPAPIPGADLNQGACTESAHLADPKCAYWAFCNSPGLLPAVRSILLLLFLVRDPSLSGRLVVP